ncbi:uroporphyrinogen decarboxylase family protein [Eubacteriaceae bacterium ES2]|nr:uroporphyrinogen decarboxylase family protein [Eubacteriaceae bacterium ES2]
MNERENALHVIMHDGKAQWLPSGADCLEMVIPTNVVRERPPFSEGSGSDYFGCWWEFDPATMGFSPLPDRQPCKDITKWEEQVTFPDPEKLDWAKAEEQAANFDRENKLSMIFWESGPWERLHALIGFQEALEALYEEPEAFAELMQAITDFKVAMVKKIKEHYNPDIVCILDDFGHQKSPFMSTEMFREMIKPYETQIGKAITDNNMIYCHHSCGSITPLMQDIYEMGPKLILGLFAPYNDQEKVMKEFGDKLVFIGPIDAQLISKADTPLEQKIAETRRCVDVFGPSKSIIFDAASMDPAIAGPVYEEFYKYRTKYDSPS